MLTYRNGQLELDGVSLAEAAERRGTPLFLFSESALRDTYAALARGLAGAGTSAIIRYSAKTNHESAVLSVLADCGSHALVSHPAEAALVLAAGFSPGRLAYQRPVLLAEDLRAVFTMGVTLVHASHPADIALIERVAGELDRPVRICLRTGEGQAGARVSPLGFLAQRLGLDEPSLFRAAAEIRRSGRLRLAGINAYIGTQQESVERYRRLVRGLTRIAGRLQAELGVSLDEIDIGGGFPSARIERLRPRGFVRRLRDQAADPGAVPPPEEFARQVAGAYERAAASLYPRPRLVAELGRAVVGNAAVLLSRVRALRGRWVFLDASRHVLPESPLLFCRQVLPVAEPDPGHPRRFVHLSGATLDTLDVLGLWRRLPSLAVGDLVALCGAGAYSISRATRYAGLAPPACLVGADGVCRQIRRAEGAADLAGPMDAGTEPESGA